MKDSIFIQIASYRDPQLLPTLNDLFAKASNNVSLNVCIAHQYSEEDKWDTLERYKDDKRVTIIDIPYKQSLGACWARNKIQQKYNGETYTLQLDSHHRFIHDWDIELISMFKSLQEKGYEKPLITSYIPSYEPDNDPQGRVNVPWGMSFDRFTPEGVVFFMPYYMDNTLTEPIPGRFYSAHFAFTLGQFCKEVQHDPSFYFHGEEITIGVRAYTHGYDIFHPHKVIAWHEYTREGRTKQWDDDPNWNDRNMHTHSMVRKLLGVDNEICSPCNKKAFEGYDLGEVRTLKQYERYSGIRFTDRAITPNCSNNEIPGKEPFNIEYIAKFKHAIDLNTSLFNHNDYTFMAVILSDKDGNELYRKDIQGDNLANHLKNNLTIWVEANVNKPHSYTLWPYSEKDGWVEKQTYNL